MRTRPWPHQCRENGQLLCGAPKPLLLVCGQRLPPRSPSQPRKRQPEEEPRRLQTASRLKWKLLSSTAQPPPPDVSLLGMPSFLDALEWCMLYTTKRGMSETDICVRLMAALAQMAGWGPLSRASSA
jgi:hypothetical protein